MMNKFTRPLQNGDPYQAPGIVLIEVAVEKGFAGSTDYDDVVLPDYNVVEETEW